MSKENLIELGFECETSGLTCQLSDQLSYPALYWRSSILSTIFAVDEVPVRSHKPRNAMYLGINTP